MKLTQERLKEVLYYDPYTGLFTWLSKTHKNSNVKVGSVAGSVGQLGYVSLQVDNSPHTAHRLAFLYMTGSWPVGVVDHINASNGDEFANRSDNRWCNLRDVTTRDNCSNRKRHRDGRSVGTTFHTSANKWQAQVQIKGKNKYLGLYDTEQEAANVRKQALKELEAKGL